jgi:hypothetical protein
LRKQILIERFFPAANKVLLWNMILESSRKNSEAKRKKALPFLFEIHFFLILRVFPKIQAPGLEYKLYGSIIFNKVLDDPFKEKFIEDFLK